jgi:NAD(P)-dependent dehydrogenase (short-subunit alcohol dehydrogenase family)
LRSARPPTPARPHTGGGGEGEFDGKVAIVTGGGAGIGYAIARAFAREGARVAIAGRTEATLTQAARTIEAESGRPVLPIAADVADAGDCERLIATTAEQLGAVNILVNNAALFAVLPLIEVEAAEAARFFAVNAIGPLNAGRAFARWAGNHKRGGAIVNVSSIAAGRPAQGLGLYSASKAALDSLTRSMAVEWAGEGLRVNAVAPGHVATEGVLEDLRTGRLDEKAVLARIPAGRIASGDDIADGVLFLCSDRARHILGHVLTIDGGESF